MKVINIRDHKTLKPTAAIEVTKLDLETSNLLMKKMRVDMIQVESPEISHLLENIDELMQELIGKEAWEKGIRENIGNEKNI